jgi:hypothetical protein
MTQINIESIPQLVIRHLSAFGGFVISHLC